MRANTQLQSKHEQFIRGNKFLTIPEALDAVKANTSSLLTKNSEINCGQQVNNRGGTKKPEDWAENTSQKFKCHVGHPPGYRRGLSS